MFWEDEKIEMKSQFEVIGILRYTLPLPRISIFIILKSCLFFISLPLLLKKMLRAYEDEDYTLYI